MSGPSTARTRGNGKHPGRIAGVFLRDGQWCAVVVDAQGEAVAECRFDLADDSLLHVWAAEHDARRVVRVLPGGSVVSRVVGVPGGSDSEIGAALELISEAELPVSVPPHRRGCGVIERTESGATGLLIGWRVEVETDASDDSFESWTGEPAALVGLLLGVGEGAAIACDRERGSVSLVTRQGGVWSVRTYFEDGSDPEVWSARVAALIEERAQAVGVAGVLSGAAAAGDQLVVLLRGRTGAVSGGFVPAPSRDESWLCTYGLAYGAARGLALLGPTGAGLYSLRAQPRREAVGPVERVVRWFAVPRRAVGVLIICAVLMLISPVIFAAVRVGVLEWKSGGLTEQVERKAELSARLALYRELDAHRWPVTKLIADIAGCVPVGEENSEGLVSPGVQVTSLRLGAGRGELVEIEGKAESFDQVLQFETRLAASGVFEQVKADRSQGSGAGPFGVEYRVTAVVARPHTPAFAAEDFAERTLAARMYGEEAASRITGASQSRAHAERDEREARGGDARVRTGTVPSEEASRERPRRESAPAVEAAPAPLTDEQIGSMDRATVMKEFGDRRRASSRSDLDAETAERLRLEVDRLRERLRAMQGGG